MEDEKEKKKKEVPAIIKKASAFVEKLYKEKLPEKYHYHSFAHTEEVVEISEEIADYYDISGDDLETLLLAGWFHDTGYTKEYDNHEDISIEIAERFLKDNSYPEEKIDKVKKIIDATRHDAKPENILEEIIKDADLAHLGKKRFFRKGEMLRVEWEYGKNKKFSDTDWENLQLRFLINSKFHTSYATKNFGMGRAKNIQKQRKNINKAIKEETRQKTGKDFGRAVDTLYRVSFNNHIELSAIADGKANMMISINTIILSVIITVAGSGLTFTSDYFLTNIRFIIPIFILLIGSLSSVIFAILSAKPNVTKDKVEQKELKNSTKSILFFGNFVNMMLENFIAGLRELKKDQELLYDKMSIDLYQLGHVLAKKYRLLSFSYLIFMSGLILSVLSFVIIFFYTYSSQP